MNSRASFYPDPAAARALFAQALSAARGPIAVIPAAGKGARAGFSEPKQYQVVSGETVLAKSIAALSALKEMAAIVVVLSPEDRLWGEKNLDQGLQKNLPIFALPIGGDTRRQSVLNGCRWIAESLGEKANPWLMVHDAARPLVSLNALARLWALAATFKTSMQGAILAAPLADTIKMASASDANPRVSQTLDRSLLWAAQTPQMFRLQDLIVAYERCSQATDEASAIEAAGGSVELVVSEASNFKLTQPQDFQMMERLMGGQSQTQLPSQPMTAVGQGFDVHALVVGRPLIIGGVNIPFDRGLEGHSDADVLLHAITDAILGAAGMGDIGRLFPDTDAAYKGADSSVLLATAVKKVSAAGWRVSQIDATVIAQAPKIAPYAQAMQEVIGKACMVSAESVNIKGKTTEQLGFIGRGEGIAAQAIALLSRS